MHTLTKKEADRHIAQIVHELRNCVRVGRYWRKNAWEQLYAVICQEGVLTADGSPLSSLVFAGLVGLAVEYLGEKPDRGRFRDLRDVVMLSMRGLGHVARHTDQNIEEMEMLGDALHQCGAHMKNIEICCPVSS